jgi:hypothetical protein
MSSEVKRAFEEVLCNKRWIQEITIVLAKITIVKARKVFDSVLDIFSSHHEWFSFTPSSAFSSRSSSTSRLVQDP